MRNDRYFTLNTAISFMTDEQISNLKSEKEFVGHGKNSIVTILNEKVFIKKIPLTKLEYENSFNASNLYDLPTFYNYGVGSSGINSFREVLMHIKTTNWVLNSEIENFPILYHYRIVKNINPLKKFEDKNEFKKYIDEWNGDKNIEKYIIDRENAEYEIILFLEYFPNVLHKSLTTDVKQIESYISQMTKTINFLNKHNIIHFDAHSANIVLDSDTFYLTDFGLVLDMEFNLTDKEKEFFSKNTHYDYAMIIENIISPLYAGINKDSDAFDKRYNLTKKMTDKEVFEIIYKNLDDIKDYLNFNDDYVNLLKKYWKIIKIIPIFTYDMRHNDKKDNVFPNDKVKNLINNINLHGGTYFDKYVKYKHKYLLLSKNKITF